jgi:hypothetical protein
MAHLLRLLGASCGNSWLAILAEGLQAAGLERHVEMITLDEAQVLDVIGFAVGWRATTSD